MTPPAPVHATAEKRFRPVAFGVGLTVVIVALVLAYETQQLSPMPAEVARAEPTIVVVLDPPPTESQRPTAHAVVTVKPGLLSCGPVTTELTLTYSEDFRLRSGHLIAVGMAGPYDVRSMRAVPVSEPGEREMGARFRQRAEQVAGNYHAIGGTIENAHGERRLQVTVSADWATDRGLGSCELHTPDVVAATVNATNAEEEAEDILVDDLGRSIEVEDIPFKPISGSVVIDPGVSVDRDLLFPPPDDPYALQWNCDADAQPRSTPESSPGCDAIVAVERSDAANIRAAALLLLGTFLGFGLQVAYDARHSRQRSSRVPRDAPSRG